MFIQEGMEWRRKGIVQLKQIRNKDFDGELLATITSMGHFVNQQLL